MDGEPWPVTFSCVWEPKFNPVNNSVVAPVRVDGKWGLAVDGQLLWPAKFVQLWHQQFSPDGEHIAAIVAPEFGRWTVAIDGTPWKSRFNDFVTDLVYSPDGRRAAALGKNGQKWFIIADDHIWNKAYDMVWKPVFSPDSEHLAVKVELAKRYTIVVDGVEYGEDFDVVWDPIFSPDSRKVMIRSVKGGKYYRIVVPVQDIK